MEHKMKVWVESKHFDPWVQNFSLGPLSTFLHIFAISMNMVVELVSFICLVNIYYPLEQFATVDRFCK